MMNETIETASKRQITIVIDGGIAYNVGFSTVAGKDFRNYAARGTEQEMLAEVARLYPTSACNVTILRMPHRAWLKAAKAARAK